MPNNWRESARKAQGETGDEITGKQFGVESVVESVSPATEVVLMSNFGGDQPANVNHPYVGVRAWHRVMPEEGATAVVSRRGGTSQDEIVYYQTLQASSRVSRYVQGIGYYRPLNSGEFEITSYGLSQIHGSRRGDLDLRGGIVRAWLSNDDLELGMKSPSYSRRLHDHDPSVGVKNEERFGVAWRYPTDGAGLAGREYPQIGGDFAREYVRSFSGLVDLREGHVLDDEGVEVEGLTGNPLRHQRTFYDVDGGFTERTVDNQGNVSHILSSLATEGYFTRIPAGGYRLEANQRVQLGAGDDFEITGNNVSVDARGTMYLHGMTAVMIDSSGLVAIQASNITLNGRVVLPGTQPI